MSIEKPTKRERQRAAKALRKAADIIRPAGRWCRGAYRDGDAFCVLGALGRAVGRNLDRDDETLPSTFWVAVDALQLAIDGCSLPSVDDYEWALDRHIVYGFNDCVKDKRILLRRMEQAAKQLEGAQS